MSDRPRSNFLTVGLALALALVIGGGLYLSANSWAELYERQSADHAQNYRDAREERARARCVIVPRPEIRTCVNQEFEAAREGERKEYDLQAQLVTSVWTRAMGIAALIGMAVGIFGVGLIYKTFEETRRTAKAAEDALDHARLVSAEELRPYVYVDEVGIPPADGPYRARPLVVTIRNFGQTPALRLHVEAGWDVLLSEDAQAVAIKWQPTPFDLAPGHATAIRLPLRSRRERVEGPDTRPALLCRIYVVYYDAAGHRHGFEEIHEMEGSPAGYEVFHFHSGGQIGNALDQS